MPQDTTERAAAAGPRRASLPVGRRWLFEIAGVIWTAVGVLLVGYAVVWLAPVSPLLIVGLALAGLVVATVFVRFVFSPIVNKNIARLEAGPSRASAFAFQGWKSYIVTIFMVGLGITLRHSSIPKPWLAIVYEGIGVALLITSVPYHRRFARAVRGKEA